MNTVDMSVIVLLYNGWHLGHARLSELYRFIPRNSEVIVVDNGSEDEDVATGLSWWERLRPEPHDHWLRVIRLPENTGFSKGFNHGISQAVGKYVMCLSSDVKIHRPFVIDIATLIGDDDTMIVGGRVIDWQAGWNQIGNIAVPYLEGWMITATRNAWNSLGGWDERYSPYDFEDVDLSMKAMSLGFNLVTAPRDIFEHQGGGTFNANLISGDIRRQQTMVNHEKFLSKWKDRIPDRLKGS